MPISLAFVRHCLLPGSIGKDAPVPSYIFTITWQGLQNIHIFQRCIRFAEDCKKVTYIPAGF